MVEAEAFHPFTFLFIFLSLFLLPHTTIALLNNNNNNNTHHHYYHHEVEVVNNKSTTSTPTSTPSPSVSDSVLQQTTTSTPTTTTINASPFKPTIAIIVALLTTLFSVTFLLFLYARHCKRNNNDVNRSRYGTPTTTTVSARKNSGINRAVIESLPLFRFSSLRGGSKDGLECAVCLTRFEPAELLRLLPKCKHAFHVECVDTWLDAHSTCPLCRYRVDPEDILLIKDVGDGDGEGESRDLVPDVVECSKTRRVSGRHSYAGGERAARPGGKATTSFRRSLDSSRGGWGGCRKDGLLLLKEEKKKRLLEHRIIISGSGPGQVGGGRRSGWQSGGFHQRWSDVQPSDLLYLRSEMIISQSRRLAEAEDINIIINNNKSGSVVNENGNGIGIGGSGSSSVINSRSVSEITGLSRFSSNKNNNINNNTNYNNNNNNFNNNDDVTFKNGHGHNFGGGGGGRQGQGVGVAAGLVSRWLAWVSSSSSSSDYYYVRSHSQPLPVADMA